MKIVFALLSLCTVVSSFVIQLENPKVSTKLFEMNDPATENPCWQQIDDEDCAMDKAYAASFIAAEWIKGMPCVQGIEDCDMPPELNAPHNRPEVDSSEVDVMDFLGLERAKSLKSKKDGNVAP